MYLNMLPQHVTGAELASKEGGDDDDDLYLIYSDGDDVYLI
jgi:hypothetical protein